MLRQGRTSSLEVDVWFFPEKQSDSIDSLYLEGPFSQLGRTLTARYPFQKAQLADREAWKAIVPEPTLWTPETPAYYKLADTPTIVGLRDLRIRADSFFLADRRWVIRAADNSSARWGQSWPEVDLVTIRNHSADDDYHAATIAGTPVILRIIQPTSQLIDQASRSAAVLMLILPDDCPEEMTRAAHSHVLLGIQLSSPHSIPAWAQFVAVTEHVLCSGWQTEQPLPVIATRQYDVKNHSAAELRQACDQFQADLDHGADYAGLWLLPETP
ncbi:hypothetical protein DTL42_10650 [Bremerella cremea]|uniref:Uncharacterized protein n=1 Tax=Bremerella cremea TaxID=1031537 RepID=A0A368KU25_9BACT|nr:hypothetical protein [Bremerella cremea]RCS50561.1 hypothetical protein DTL42_10650 [Bremerella cremea]